MKVEFNSKTAQATVKQAKLDQDTVILNQNTNRLKYFRGTVLMNDKRVKFNNFNSNKDTFSVRLLITEENKLEIFSKPEGVRVFID